ncbi:MAG: trigger factor [Chloroflexi bacterium]|nr:trigger factor [Chloroflexota bacterium]MBF6606831.1 trigger factor [Chloroflexota bacterium]
MNVTSIPAPKSSIVLTVELPPERLDRAVDEAVRRLSRRTKVAGFRPGKAPRAVLERVLGPEAVHDEAVEHLVSDAYRAAILEQDLVPLTRPEVEVVRAIAGEPVVFTATVQVRPEVTLGDYRSFTFRPEIEAIDDAKVATVLDELRDQNAALTPSTEPAKKGDYAIIAYRGTRDGEPFEGGSTERMPLIIGNERLIPGFEDHLVGIRAGGSTAFDIDFPTDYAEPGLAGRTAHFEVDLRELRTKVLPDLDDEFARSMGEYPDLAAFRVDVRHRLERNALDRARHGFSDRIIDYAVANSTLELPDVLVDQEIEVMHDEFRSSLVRQGITEEAYLKVVKQTEADLHAEFRPRAEGRVKTLLVLSKIAETEGVTVDEATIETEIAAARVRYRGEPKLLAYFESDRGRAFLRSTLRRSQTVERLVDEWLVAHPDHPPIPHAESDEPAAISLESAAASAAIGATDPDAGPAAEPR